MADISRFINAEPAALQEALRLAALGYPVFPCCPDDGRLDEDGKPLAKRPATPNGFHDATTDPEKIRQWWRANPRYNLGLKAEGLLITDADPLDDGSPNTWPHDEAKRQDLLAAPSQSTPRAGRHNIFRRPFNHAWKCSTGKLAPKVDTRTTGGYAVVAPSTVGGKPYLWTRAIVVPPSELPLPPQWLVDELDRLHPVQGAAQRTATTGGSADGADGEGETIPEGQRNAGLASVAGKLRKAGLDSAAIEAALLEHNRRCCSPPLPDAEVRRIAESIGRYPAGTGSPKGGTGSPPTGTGTPEKSGKKRVPVPVPVMEPWKSFPLDCLPDTLRRFVESAASCIGCDHSFIALPLLAMLASVIGSKRRILIKRGWTEGSVLWVAVVGESGTVKSPAIEIAVKPIKRRQEKAFRKFAAEMAEFTKERQIHEAVLSQWKKKPHGEPPVIPEPPVCPRTYTSDVTPEKLAVILQQNTGSGFILMDELAKLLGGFDKYKGGKGGEAALMLELHGGRGAVIDRKNSGTIYIKHACVSVCGGIQPGILRRCLTGEHQESGLAARFLFANPPRIPRQWRDEDMDPERENDLVRLVDRLSDLEHGTDEEGEPEPILVRLSREARRLYITFVDEHGRRQLDTSGSLAAALSKLEGSAARLALVLHLSRWAAGEDISPDEVDGTSMGMGIRLSHWFSYEAGRIYGVMSDTEEQSDTRGLIDWIRTRGGRCTAQQLSHGPRRWRGPVESAEALLRELVRLGLGSWETVETGGRPTLEFVLARVELEREPPKTSGFEGDPVPENTLPVPVELVPVPAEVVRCRF